jgi:hypothetical protein
MKKTWLLYAFILIIFNSCKKENKYCIQVKYVTSYCPKAGADVVALYTGSPEHIVLLNIPESFRVKDNVFFITYHYDESVDELDDVICPAIYIPQKIFVCDSASEEDCN